jgi:hypothetical protein
MRYGVGLVVGVVGLILSLGGCEESSDGSAGPSSGASGSSSSGGSTAEPDCGFDADEDGYCDDTFSSDKPDCNDANPDVHPGAPEAANAIDDDCDGVIDNGVSAACPLTLEEPAGGCERAEQLVAFGAGACLLVDSGRVLCWGHNANGALGTPDVVNAPVPIAVPGVASATALAAGPGVVCALAGEAAICWGANSAFPFTVELPEGTTQIALGTAKQASGAVSRLIGALDGAGQVWVRSLLALDPAEATKPLEFLKGEADAKQLVGGKELCSVSVDDQLRCPGEGGLVTIAAQIESVAQSFDGSLCYKSNGQLYCSPSPASGTVVAGNGSAVGFAAVAGTGCAFNEAGKLACWTENGPTSVTDAAGVALGTELGCVLRQSGKVSCWGNSDGGRLGNGQARPGTVADPVDIIAAPTLELPAIVLLGAAPLGACDTQQDLNALHQGVRVHPALTGCKEECANRLDSSECFASCATPGGLSSGCFACYTNLATCTGADCYAAFQTCAGYPVDFAEAVSNAPRFACEGAACLRGKSVGQPCSEEDLCTTGACEALPQAPDTRVCAAADGTFCMRDSSHCACDLGSDSFGESYYGYCGGCYGEGRTASLAGDCYRDCTQQSYCTAGQVCKYFSDGRTRYCGSP